MKLLSAFLRRPGEFFQDERRRRNLIISLFGILFVCSLLTMIQSVTRTGSPLQNPDASSTPALLNATNTKWWLRKDPSPAPTNTPNLQALIATQSVTVIPEKCPAYAADLKPGTYGYISLFPPYENTTRSGAGKNFPLVGSIEAGGWVKILEGPICADDGYVWLKVQSDRSAGSWTAGGGQKVQWILPCPELDKKCTPKKWIRHTSPPRLDGSGGQANSCLSDKLAVGLNAQVSPDDLLVVRASPDISSVLGHISPAVVVTIIDGPKCEGGAVWWKVISEKLSGWAVENLLKSCPKEGECKPWE